MGSARPKSLKEVKRGLFPCQKQAPGAVGGARAKGCREDTCVFGVSDGLDEVGQARGPEGLKNTRLATTARFASDLDVHMEHRGGAFKAGGRLPSIAVQK